MATILNTTYPPIVDSFMPAFLYTKNAKIFFSTSAFTSIDDIDLVHVAISNQKNNKNMLRGTTSTGIDAKPSILPIKVAEEVGFDEERGQYYIEIPAKIVSKEEEWTPNTFYKVQLRFQLKGSSEDITEYYSIKNQNACKIQELSSFLMKNSNLFTEWSTVCLLRPIWIPDIYCATRTGWVKSLNKFINATASTRPGECPLFPIGELKISGKCLFTDKTSPMTIGSANKNNVIKTTSEHLSSYKISILNGNKKPIENKVHSWSYTANTKDPNDIIDSFDLTDLEIMRDSVLGIRYTYYILFEGITCNGYSFEKMWKFKLTDAIDSTPWNFYPRVDNLNGVVALNIMYSPRETGMIGSYFGALHVRRTSSRTNFKEWETVRSYKIRKGLTDDYVSRHPEEVNFVFIDNTVESLVGYKYRIQFENANGLMYTPKYLIPPKEDETSNRLTLQSVDDKLIKETNSNNHLAEMIIMPDFDGALLSRKDRQLHLGFNFKVKSITPTVKRAKTETLGGKYPKFTENAMLNYKVLSIEGMISSQDDNGDGYAVDETWTNDSDKKWIEDSYFGPTKESDCYYEIDEKGTFFVDWNNKLLKQTGTTILGNCSKQETVGETFYNYYYSKKNSCGNASHASNKLWGNNLESYDYMWEREFREHVVAWLNDGEPKLMRTKTEGNIVVILTDISLSPVEGTSRRLYSFSATAHEVADARDLKVLDSLGIYSIIKDSYISDGENGTLMKRARIGAFTNFSSKQREDMDILRAAEDHWSFIQRNSFGRKEELGAKLSNNLANKSFMRDVKLRFRNRPHGFSADGSILDLSSLREGEEPHYYGYQLELKTGDNSEYTKIFVPPSGYFQVPSAIKVFGLRLVNEEDYVDIDYVLYFALTSFSLTEQNLNEGRYVIGQIAETVSPHTKLFDLVKDKYLYADVAHSEEDIESFYFVPENNNNDESVPLSNDGFQNDADSLINNPYSSTSDFLWKLNYVEELSSWNGLILEATPYSKFKISYQELGSVNSSKIDFSQKPFSLTWPQKGKIVEEEIVIGDTGYLNLSEKGLSVVEIEYLGMESRIGNRDRIYTKDAEKHNIYNTFFDTVKESNENIGINLIYEGRVTRKEFA